MFDFKRALHSVLQTHPDDELATLSTVWGECLDPENVLQEYPRPQMRRNSYICLNGYWDYVINYGELPDSFDGRILVPFSPEAPLSGVGRQLPPGESLWYRRRIRVSVSPRKRLLLHFEAVDYKCECFVNGTKVGAHAGAYAPFFFDITEAAGLFSCGGDAEIEILLSVRDPSEFGFQPRGKQRLERGSIWYTAQSGIWQTVWLEEVPSAYISDLDVHADPDARQLRLTADISGMPCGGKGGLKVVVSGGGRSYSAESETMTDGCISVTVDVDDPHLWSPDDPFLYEIRASFRDDLVESYCAFRTFTVEFTPEEGSGRRTFCCNHKPLFLKGILDQGYWPDGLMTAPSDEALVFDIELAKRLGFNMMRKHLKAESTRWYYHCDRMGMIVMQDMVNGGDCIYSAFYTCDLPTTFPRLASRVDDTKDLVRFGSEVPKSQILWLAENSEMMRHLRFFPSIAAWTVFNEGWGQFDAMEMTRKLREIDHTRPIDQASGWYDQGGGDFVSEHNYFRALTVPKPRTKGDRRAPIISEFGGAAYHVAENSALERSYGYDTCEDCEEFCMKVEDAISHADALEKEGLAGYVYTQLSDVEEEVNGLVTYDRKFVKFRKPSPYGENVSV